MVVGFPLGIRCTDTSIIMTVQSSARRERSSFERLCHAAQERILKCSDFLKEKSKQNSHRIVKSPVIIAPLLYLLLSHLLCWVCMPLYPFNTVHYQFRMHRDTTYQHATYNILD